MQRLLDEGFCKVGLHRVSELPRNYKFSFSSVQLLSPLFRKCALKHMSHTQPLVTKLIYQLSDDTPIR